VGRRKVHDECDRAYLDGHSLFETNPLAGSQPPARDDGAIETVQVFYFRRPVAMDHGVLARSGIVRNYNVVRVAPANGASIPADEREPPHGSATAHPDGVVARGGSGPELAR